MQTKRKGNENKKEEEKMNVKRIIFFLFLIIINMYINYFILFSPRPYPSIEELIQNDSLILLYFSSIIPTVFMFLYNFEENKGINIKEEKIKSSHKLCEQGGKEMKCCECAESDEEYECENCGDVYCRNCALKYDFECERCVIKPQIVKIDTKKGDD